MYVPVNEIVYLQGYGYNTVIGVISGEKYNVQESQKKILERLPQYVTKIHQSYAINRKIVAQIDTNWLVTKTGMSIPLARKEIKWLSVNLWLVYFAANPTSELVPCSKIQRLEPHIARYTTPIKQ